MVKIKGPKGPWPARLLHKGGQRAWQTHCRAYHGLENVQPTRPVHSPTQDIQAEAKNKIEKANARYKAYVDSRRKVQLFNVGNEAMVFLSKNRIVGAVISLNRKDIYGPFKIKKKINDNAFVGELPLWTSNISTTFNVADLSPYSHDCELGYADKNSRATSLQVEVNDGGIKLAELY